jgi:hypothetical protein
MIQTDLKTVSGPDRPPAIVAAAGYLQRFKLMTNDYSIFLQRKR